MVLTTVLRVLLLTKRLDRPGAPLFMPDPGFGSSLLDVHQELPVLITHGKVWSVRYDDCGAHPSVKHVAVNLDDTKTMRLALDEGKVVSLEVVYALSKEF